ncbi:MAG: TetR/AcrR family transcriptional regulator [Henriciella sp.]|nr:TetR/AcrR family transcriptional regulator [Henriciella sp.]
MTAFPPTSPAERRRHKVRTRILSAAETVLASDGVDGLSIRRLAEKIDYSPSAIYKYFGSKDELVFELKEAFFEKILERIDHIVDKQTPFHVRARDCVATYVEIAVDKPHHYAAAFAGQIAETGPSEDEPGFQDTKKGLAFSVLKKMVQEGIDDGHFRPDLNASLAAKSIWASCHGLAMMRVHAPSFPSLNPNKTTISPEKFTEFHADLVVRGLEFRS